jgi:hypothetical protein
MSGFKHERHNDILRIIQAMDQEFLNENYCFFAGGTAIAMAYGEQRLSFDIDFLVNDTGMKAIRDRVFEGGLRSLFQKDSITTSRESKNGYSIKALVSIDDKPPIKLEIVNEGRIKLEGCRGTISQDENLMTITPKTMVTQKFLALTDRGLDVGYHHRDFWDLMILAENVSKPEFRAGYSAAKLAYGKSVESSITKVQKEAIKHKKSDADFLKIEDFQRLEKRSKTILSYIGIDPGL